MIAASGMARTLEAPEVEQMSGQVAENVIMIPFTRAHGLESLEIKKTLLQVQVEV